MITKNYIKMCEQAEEIQKAWIQLIGDWAIFPNIPLPTVIRYNKTINKMNKDEYTWLPTQEQLQEMILNHGHQGYDNSGIATMLSLFSMDYKLEDLTFTELWLHYVMKEKYNKIWDDKRWK